MSANNTPEDAAKASYQKVRAGFIMKGTTLNEVSASALPYAAQLDATAKFQGIRSSMRLLGCPSSNARSVSER